MKHFILALFFCFFFSNPGHAQLPPVTFPSGTNVCDPSPWQLVFSDDFNGDTLDRTKWHSYTVWDGQETDNWSGARVTQNNIWVDSDVVVSDGTCKLKLYYFTNSWHCATCSMATVTKNYTSGEICTYYTNKFNSGLFETRMKMPDFDEAHTTFWAYFGGDVDELDFAEAYGDPYYPEGVPGINNRLCTYSLNAWAPNSNPYDLSHVEITNHYPNQTWWNYVTGTYFDQTAWHTYACEWDTAVVNNYIDGSLVNTQWKYYKTGSFTITDWWLGPPVTYTYMIPSQCSVAGTYNILPGFPYNNESNSDLRFTLSTDDPGHYPNYLSPIFTGQSEIDYVRVWQRHPANDGHTVICDDTVEDIVGLPYMCGGDAIYSPLPIASDGTWSTTGPIETIDNDYAIGAFAPASSPSTSQGTITYTHSGDAGCPPVSATIPVDIGPPLASNWNGVVSLTYIQPSHEKFNLTASAVTQPNSATTYEWAIWYGSNPAGPFTYYTASGQTVSTPIMSDVTSAHGYISWTLTITNACGSITLSGQKTYSVGPFLPGDTHDDSLKNIANLYVKAIITDTGAYQTALRTQIAQTFIEDTSDTVAIMSTINRIAMENLAPYIVFDSTPKGVLAVTEISTGPTAGCQYVEMIVANCDTDSSDAVDVRGWIIDDNSGNFDVNGCMEDVGIAKGHYRLAYDSIWSSVPVGSIIVLYNHDNNCYNLSDSFSITTNTDTKGLVYWVPIGGTCDSPYRNPPVERSGIGPANDNCAYCSGDDSTYYTVASSWLSTIGLKNAGDAIQVRCPGCTATNNSEPAFYHGIGYGLSSGDDAFASFDAGDNDLGGVVINDTGGDAKYIFIDSSNILGKSTNWTEVKADGAGHTPSTLGNVPTRLMDAITAHTLDLPCCSSGGDGMRKTNTTGQQGSGTLPNIGSTPQDIKVYPNPANTVIYFEFPTAPVVTIKILDVKGSVLDMQVVNNSAATTFNVSNYTPGVYMYQVITNNKVHSGKVLIER